MISVCMAVYNGMPYIVDQIESILPQLSPDDELILSDDGSDDGTLQWVEGLGDARIKVFSNDGRKGPVGNFENAILASSGDYIFLCDQDDVWVSNKVSVMVGALKECVLVVSDCTIVDKDGVVIGDSFFRSRGSGPGLVNNLWRNSYLGCCMAFRRELIDFALPFPGGIHMHDWWLGLCAELLGRVDFLERKLIMYRRHGANASETWNGSENSVAEKLRRRISVLWPLASLYFDFRFKGRGDFAKR